MNYAFMTGNVPDVEDGHTFVGDNFIQQLPNTKILEGKRGIKFINCNLTNCILPIDAVTEGAHTKQRSFCSHEHPEWDLEPCEDECIHMVSKDEIWIDGILIDTIYEYSDKVV